MITYNFWMPSLWPTFPKALVIACTATLAARAFCAGNPPTAAPDTYEVLQETEFQGNVLLNDTDPEGDAMAATLSTQPLNGTLELAGNGDFTYNPRAGFLGIDSFRYTVSDGTSTAPAASVTLNVVKPEPKVVINEIMYNPDSPGGVVANLPYSDFKHEYIELYNAGTSGADLSGWYFDKGIDFTFKAGTTIAAGEYILVVYDKLTFISAYGNNTSKVYSGSRGKLSNSGETIRLKDASGKIKDEVQYFDNGDWSERITSPVDRWGATGWIWDERHDGGGHSLELRNPWASNKRGQNWTASAQPKGTPGTQNSAYTTDIAPFIKDVSHSPAIPTSSDSVIILAEIEDDTEAAPANAYLRWRLDGQGTFQQTPMLDDGLADDGKAGNLVYGATIPAQADNSIIEFYVQADDGNLTRTWPSHTNYDPTERGANALYMVSGTHASMDTSKIPDYLLVMTQAEYTKRVSQVNKLSNAMVNATLITTFEGRSEVRYQIGLRFRGSGSRDNNPKPYRVDIPGETPWEGITSMNLNPVSWDSQLIGSHIFNRLGQPSARAVAIQLYFNQNRLPSNTSQFYTHLQPLNSEFAELTFPNDPNGNVYRPRRPGEEPHKPGGQNPNLSYYADITEYRSYTKNSNQSLQNWTDVQKMTLSLDSSNLTNSTDFFDFDNPPMVLSHIHLDSWLQHLALHSLVVNKEGGLVATGDNTGDDYALYAGAEDQRFHFVAHDLDTLWNDMLARNLSPNQSDYTRSVMPFTGVAAFNRLVNHPQIRPRYLAIYNDMATNFFQTDKFEPFLQNIVGGIVTDANIQKVVDAMKLRTDYLATLAVFTQLVPPPLYSAITSAPPTISNQTTATFQIGGKDAVYYTYKLDDAPFVPTDTAVHKVDTPLQFQGLAPGQHTLVVHTANPASGGGLQYDIVGTSHTWTVDPTHAPVMVSEILTANQAAYQNGSTFPDYIELYNPMVTPYDLTGHSLTDNLDNPQKFNFPDGTEIPAAGYLLVHADSDTTSPGLHTGFGLDSEGDRVYLVDNSTSTHAILDSHAWGLQLPDMSIGQDPSTGHWTLNSPTPGAANQSSPTLAETDTLRINEFLADPAFNLDSDFIEIYNPGILPADMGGFILTDNPIGDPRKHPIHPNTFIPAQGFAIFRATGKSVVKDSRQLNFKLTAHSEMIALYSPQGQEIDTILFGPQHKDKSRARSTDGGPLFTTLDIPTPGFSNTATDPLLATLRQYLRITEVHYNPAPGTLYEYIELQNSGTSGLDLSGLNFNGAIDYTFAQGTSLAPSGYLTLAYSPTHYQQLYGHAPQGQYTGKLDNAGEKIRLQNANAVGILEFTYNDAWYPYTDGLGYSLQLRDTSTDNALLGTPEAWATSKTYHGSPGGPEPANTAPTAIRINPSTIPHDTPAYTAISAISHTDTFPLDPVTYTLLEPDTGQFTLLGNEILLAEVLADNQTEPIGLRIRVTDSFGASFEDTLTLTITRELTDVDVDQLPDEWENHHFGSISQLPNADADNDGQDNYTEYLAGTDPTDPQDTFAIMDPAFDGQSFSFTFDAKPGKTYTLQSITAPGQREWRDESSTTIQTGLHSYIIPKTDNNPGKLYRILLTQ